MTDFKPGDWVRYKGIAQISHITHTGYHLSNGYITKGDNGEIKLWTPEEGEWCWFWNDNELPILDKLHKYHNLKDHLGNYETERHCLYHNCEPFIGQLPTTIKDNT